MMARKPPVTPQKPSKTDEEDNENDEDDEENRPSLRKQFMTFVKYKNDKDPGTHILLSQSDFWMKQAGVIMGRKLTQTDTGVCYFKFKKYKLSYNEYLEFLQVLADYKNIPVEEIIEKLINCQPPTETNINVGVKKV